MNPHFIGGDWRKLCGLNLHLRTPIFQAMRIQGIPFFIFFWEFIVFYLVYICCRLLLHILMTFFVFHWDFRDRQTSRWYLLQWHYFYSSHCQAAYFIWLLLFFFSHLCISIVVFWVLLSKCFLFSMPRIIRISALAFTIVHFSLFFHLLFIFWVHWVCSYRNLLFLLISIHFIEQVCWTSFKYHWFWT